MVTRIVKEGDAYVHYIPENETDGQDTPPETQAGEQVAARHETEFGYVQDAPVDENDIEATMDSDEPEEDEKRG